MDQIGVTFSSVGERCLLDDEVSSEVAAVPSAVVHVPAVLMGVAAIPPAAVHVPVVLIEVAAVLNAVVQAAAVLMDVALSPPVR